jgi:hypothetical protein
MVASMTPLGLAPEPEPAEKIENNSAGAWLERGFVFFHQNRPRESADAFSAAIATGNLNHAGRALAYWHIAQAERRLYNEDRTTEALSSFAVVAQDVLDIRGQKRYAVDEEGDFVEHFQLKERVAEALGYLNAVWARRAEHYARSLENAVVTRSADEARYFIQFVSPCGRASHQSVKREVLGDGEGVPFDTLHIERVTIICDPSSTGEQYFVIVPDPSFVIVPDPIGTDGLD